MSRRRNLLGKSSIGKMWMLTVRSGILRPLPKILRRFGDADLDAMLSPLQRSHLSLSQEPLSLPTGPFEPSGFVEPEPFSTSLLKEPSHQVLSMTFTQIHRRRRRHIYDIYSPAPYISQTQHFSNPRGLEEEERIEKAIRDARATTGVYRWRKEEGSKVGYQEPKVRYLSRMRQGSRSDFGRREFEIPALKSVMLLGFWVWDGVID